MATKKQRTVLATELDVEAEMNRLWSEYLAGRADHFRSYDFDAVSRYVRKLRTRAKKLGLELIAGRLEDLAGYNLRAKHEQIKPEKRLVTYWPGLWPPAIEEALQAADEALRDGAPPKLRQAARALRFCDQPERLADIAEEDLAAEFAAWIPGAVDDAGMLVLSKEHEALLDRASTTLGRVRAALGPRGSPARAVRR